MLFKFINFFCVEGIMFLKFLIIFCVILIKCLFLLLKYEMDWMIFLTSFKEVMVKLFMFGYFLNSLGVI